MFNIYSDRLGIVIVVNKIPSSKQCSEPRPNLTKHSSLNNVSKTMVVQGSNGSSELNSDLVVRLLFSVTI